MDIRLPTGRARLKAFLLFAAVTALPLSARAQDDQALERTGIFDRNYDVTVRERPRPEFTGTPIPVEGFLLTPTLTGSFEYNDNIRATDTGAVSDGIFRIQPNVLLASNWSRNFVSAFANASANEYLTHSSETTTDWSTGLTGRLDIQRDWGLTASSVFQQETEPRTSPLTFTDTRSPTRFTVGESNVETTREFGRLRLTALGDIRDYTYDDDSTPAGALVYEQDRDREVISGVIQGEYALIPETSIVGEVTLNKRDFAHRLSTEPSRNSGGVEASLGANFDFTRLLRGEVHVGYLEQDYRDPAYKNGGGLSLHGNVIYFPTQLITLTLTASRTVEDADVIGASNFLQTEFALQADYELLRNLIISGGFNFAHDSYQGYDRTDQQYVESLSATYLVNRQIGLSLKYSNSLEQSTGVDFGPRYNVNSLAVQVVYQYGG